MKQLEKQTTWMSNRTEAYDNGNNMFSYGQVNNKVLNHFRSMQKQQYGVERCVCVSAYTNSIMCCALLPLHTAKSCPK